LLVELLIERLIATLSVLGVAGPSKGTLGLPLGLVVSLTCGGTPVSGTSGSPAMSCE
jgi:hypothetical protein